MNAKILVNRLGLAQHPEGGYYRETCRGAGIILAGALSPMFGGDRYCSTVIFFLPESRDISRLRRIRSDKIWYFYSGGPLGSAMISPGGKACEIVPG